MARDQLSTVIHFCNPDTSKIQLPAAPVTNHLVPPNVDVIEQSEFGRVTKKLQLSAGSLFQFSPPHLAPLSLVLLITLRRCTAWIYLLRFPLPSSFLSLQV